MAWVEVYSSLPLEGHQLNLQSTYCWEGESWSCFSIGSAASVFGEMQSQFASAELILAHLAKVKLDYEQICAHVADAKEKQHLAVQETEAINEECIRTREAAEALRACRVTRASEIDETEIAVIHLRQQFARLESEISEQETATQLLSSTEALLTKDLEAANHQLFQLLSEKQYLQLHSHLNEEISRAEMELAESRFSRQVLQERKSELKFVQSDILEVLSLHIRISII